MTNNSRQALDVAAAISKIPFQNAESAHLSFERVVGRLPADLAVAFPALLAEIPDPDCALLFFERLIFEGSGETLHWIERHNILAHYSLIIFGNSRYLGETLLQNPDLLQGFIRKNALERSFSREDFEEALARFLGRSEPDNTSVLLARFKRREYVRILLRDVLKLAPLAETTAEISALSDVLIEAAFREAEAVLQHRFGTPQHNDAGGRLVRTPFTILSLGKLGGNEVNYCSDIDLLYLYGYGQDPTPADVTNKEYFIRLAQEVTETLSRLNPEGPVFRIDLRLRPQGNEGELAINLEEALRYYADAADDWERQALIKVRHSAGDPGLAKAFIRAVQPYVYSKNINFAAIKTALVSREKMQVRRKRALLRHRGHAIDVKIDSGGIRDIEFLVQCLQRVYGGAEPWLRSGGTLFSLQKLHDKGHLTGKEFDELSSAYDFLRRVEHCLQLRDGQRVHRLPADSSELHVLARSMNQFWRGQNRFNDLVSAAKHRMTAVAEVYQRVIYQQELRRESEVRGADFHLTSTPEPGQGATEQQIFERLASDSPALLRIITRPELDAHTRRNLLRFLSAAFTSSERYSAVVRHPEAVECALRVFEVSDYLTDLLVRYPEEISRIGSGARLPQNAGSAYLFDGPFTAWPGHDPVFEYLSSASAPYSDKVSLLREHYRHQILTTGVRDITTSSGIYETLQLNTAIADAVIRAALEIAGGATELCVLALGRLGSREFDVLSDADLLFVCDDNNDRARLTRVVEQIVHTLSAYTRDGTVVPVDTRLRPHGIDGELIVTTRQLEEYFSDEAQPWEALMYTKLRFSAGSPDLSRRLAAATRSLFQRYAADPGFRNAILDMRSKLEPTDAEALNIKTSPGGTYDIDFIVTYLFVRHGAQEMGGNLRDRLWRCVDLKILDKTIAAALDYAAELFRTTEHVVRLVTGRAHKWLPSTQHARETSERLIEQNLGWRFPEGVEADLRSTLAQVRSIYRKTMV